MAIRLSKLVLPHTQDVILRPVAPGSSIGNKWQAEGSITASAR